jgi:hypothetical protein
MPTSRMALREPGLFGEKGSGNGPGGADDTDRNGAVDRCTGAAGHPSGRVVQ